MFDVTKNILFDVTKNILSLMLSKEETTRYKLVSRQTGTLEQTCV